MSGFFPLNELARGELSPIIFGRHSQMGFQPILEELISKKNTSG
jgi:hypothetical protein